jgi:hypothetical protein
LYGKQAVAPDDNGWVTHTGLGLFLIWSDAAVAGRYPQLERPINIAAQAAEAIGLRCRSLAQARPVLMSGIARAHSRTDIFGFQRRIRQRHPRNLLN